MARRPNSQGHGVPTTSQGRAIPCEVPFTAFFFTVCGASWNGTDHSLLDPCDRINYDQSPLSIHNRGRSPSDKRSAYPPAPQVPASGSPPRSTRRRSSRPHLSQEALRWNPRFVTMAANFATKRLGKELQKVGELNSWLWRIF